MTQRELVSVRSPSLIVPSVQAFFNSKQQNWNKLNTGHNRLLLLRKARNLNLSAFRLHRNQKIKVFGWV